MNRQIEMDWDEAFAYRPGLLVERIAQPGTFDTIAQYEADLVPPIWLANDPIPRYPHELRIITSSSQTPNSPGIQASSLQFHPVDRVTGH